MRIWRLFVGAMPCSDQRSYVVASWQYVTGYWRWCIWFYPNDRGWPRIAPASHDWWSHFATRIRTPFGTFNFSTQQPMESMKRAKP